MEEEIALGAPHMSDAEVALFESIVATSRRYLEFGIGGSSLVAVRSKVGTIVSVDSDAKWVAVVKRHPEVAPRIADGTMSVLHADIGPVREWGNPVNRDHIFQWPRYLSTAWSEWLRRREFPDVILVDGRFRIACCFSAFIAAAGRPTSELPAVLIHDFNDERPQYREVLELFDVKQQVGSLCHLHIREKALAADALARILERQFEHG